MKPEIHGHSIRSILIGPSFTIFSVDSQIRGLKIIGWSYWLDSWAES